MSCTFIKHIIRKQTSAQGNPDLVTGDKEPSQYFHPANVVAQDLQTSPGVKYLDVLGSKIYFGHCLLESIISLTQALKHC